MNLGRVIAHIPARGGSKRVPSKNLRYLAGRPLLSYAIDVGRACEGLSALYVNTDSPRIAALARSLNCEVYVRPSALGSDETSGEEFTIDVIERFRPDTLLMISPVCPLVQTADLHAALAAYAASEADTLISCSTTRLQAFCDGRPVNVTMDGPLAPSQRNPEVTICNWAVTIWNADVFRTCFAYDRSGYFGRRRLFWPLDPLRSVKISEEADFQLAEALIEAGRPGSRELSDAPRYWGDA